MSKRLSIKGVQTIALALSAVMLGALPSAAVEATTKDLPAAPARKVPAKDSQAVNDFSSPQSILTIYVNDLNLPGWQAQPFYMWTQTSEAASATTSNATGNGAPGASTTAASGAGATAAPGVATKATPTSEANSAPGSAANAPSPATSPATSQNVASSAPQASSAGQAPPAPPAETGPKSVHGASPKLPDGDSAREAILAEYRLTGFFRKKFQRGQRYIYIDVYDFQNPEGAYGAYNYLRKGSTTVLPRGDAASEDDNSISLVQGKTFFSIYGTSHDDDETKEVLSKVAGQAVTYIGDRGLQPSILQRLPRLDLLHGSEKIVMGPYSVRRFFPAPYLNALSLDNGRAVGCVADYQMQEPTKERLKLLILSFKSPADALASYRNFLAQVAQVHDEDVGMMARQTINVFKTGSSYLGIELSGPDLLMITGARKRYSPALVLRQVR